MFRKRSRKQYFEEAKNLRKELFDWYSVNQCHKETEERFIKGRVRNEIHIIIRYIGKTVLLYLIKGVTYVYYRIDGDQIVHT